MTRLTKQNTNNNETTVFKFQANQANEDNMDTCKLARLDLNEKVPPEVKCVRVPPVQDSCQIAEKIFHSEPPPKCKDQNTHTICSIGADQQVRKDSLFKTNKQTNILKVHVLHCVIF